jgi:hypothetical protein
MGVFLFGLGKGSSYGDLFTLYLLWHAMEELLENLLRYGLARSQSTSSATVFGATVLDENNRVSNATLRWICALNVELTNSYKNKLC